jgi:hypothetical protein
VVLKVWSLLEGYTVPISSTPLKQQQLFYSRQGIPSQNTWNPHVTNSCNIQPHNQKAVTYKMIHNTILHKASLFLQSIQLYSARHNKKQDIMHIQRQCKQGRQGMYKCNIEAHSHDHCCCGKSCKYYILSVCACILAVVIQHANSMCRPVLWGICGLSGSTIFLQSIS